MAYPGKKISQLTATTTINDSSLIPVVVTPGVSTETNKITIANAKAVLKGDKGDTGSAGDDAYVYIAYASDASGTGFTTTFNAALDYIAVKSTTTPITSPAVGDFVGLWKNYKGAAGADSTVAGPQGIQGIQGNSGTNGTDGADAYVYIAYASDDTGTDFTLTFNPLLDYIAVKNTTVAIPSPIVTDFTGLWKNYKGATGPAGSGNVSKVGTPVDNQVGVWTGDGTLEGTANLTFDSSTGILNVTSPGSGMGSIILDNGDTGAGVKLQSANSPGSGVITVPNTTATMATTTDVAAKVTANTAITGATKTKITYDTKGLVTAGADATADDIADGTNTHLITTAQQTVLNNTSGTNTGDSSGHSALAPIDNPTFTTGITTPAIKITTGAGLNKVLTSDADGDATWAAPATSVSVTTKGDLQTYSTVPDRLPVGTDGQILESRASEATGLKWVAPSSPILTLAPSADTVSSNNLYTITAHENVVFGDVCYINADSEAQIIDADAIATSKALFMATATISANASGVFMQQGVAHCHTLAPTWTVGNLIYGTVTGTSTNTMSQTAPTGVDDCVVILGVAVAADTILFNPGFQSVVERT